MGHAASMWESRDSVPALLRKGAGGFTLSRNCVLCAKPGAGCCKGYKNDYSIPTDLLEDVRKSFGEGNGMGWALNVK